MIADNQCAGRARATLDKQLNAFKLQTRRLAERIFIGSGDACFFKPYLNKGNNLAGVGLIGTQAALSFNIVISAQAQRRIATCLISLGIRCTKQKCNDILDGLTKVSPVKLCLKGKTAWDASLDNCNRKGSSSDEHLPVHDVEHDHVSSAAGSGSNITSVPIGIVSCPRCNKESPASNYQLQHADQIKCIECKHNTPCRGWRCTCGIPWHVCSKHVIGKALVNVIKPARKSHIIARGATSKRKLLLDAPFEQLLDDDLSKEAKRAKLRCLEANDQVITLGLAPPEGGLRATWLSPKLRERFSSTLAPG